MDHQHGRQRAAEVLSNEQDADDIARAIRERVALHAGLKVASIQPHQRLVADLAINGNNAERLLKALVVEFDVDFEGFVFARYFDVAEWDYWTNGLVLLRRRFEPGFEQRWRTAKQAEREISVAHLTEVATAKRWRDSDTPRPEAPRSWNAIFGVVCLVAVIAAPLVFLLAQSLLGFFVFALGAAALLWFTWQSIDKKLASAPG